MVCFSFDPVDIEDSFLWLAKDHPYMASLRERYKVNSLIREEMDEVMIVEAIMNWVHHLWEHDGEHIPQQFDPLSILEQVERGNKFRCVEYAVVLNGCLNAVGLTSRVLSLKTADCEERKLGAGHVVVETFIPRLQKWVMADPQFNVILYEGERPLHAVEAALADKRSVKTRRIFADGFNYLDWIEQYLFYFSINFDNRIDDTHSYKEKEQLMLVPLGAARPKVFQRVQPIGKVVYTHSADLFYRKPF